MRIAGWLLALACASSSAAEAWLTTGDQARLLAPAAVDAQVEDGLPAITVDAARRYQSIAGFGAAMTDSSAWLIQHRLADGPRAALMAELFGRGQGGLGLSLLRLTIGASDFSLSHYSVTDTPHPAELLPLLKTARAINPALQLIASPWSAPAAMKTSGSLIKGTLKPEAFSAYADYLTRYLDAMAALGLPVAWLTVQNEPHHEPGDYPGMRLSPAQRAALVGLHLGPRLAARGTRLLEWDHNWDEPESPLAVLADARARPYIAGVAWHCYAGDVAAQSRVREAYPDKEVWFTECAGGEWSPRWATNLLWNTRQLVIGATRHWARGVVLWNLALDERHGPHLGGCGDCRGVLTVANGQVTRNPEYYALAHASRFLRPGARRVDSQGEGAGSIAHVAFCNEDGSRVLIVANPAAAPRRFAVREGASRFAFTLPAESVVTLRWSAA